MKKISSARQAYEDVAEIARKKGQTPGGYAESKGVSRYLISKWKCGKIKSVRLEVAVKLGIV